MKELKTKFGTLYFEAADINESFLYVLLDSDKKFITNIYCKSSLREIERIEYLEEIFEIIGRGFYSHSLEGLVVELNNYLEELTRIYAETYEPYTTEAYDPYTLEELNDNSNVKYIGEHYIYLLP